MKVLDLFMVYNNILGFGANLCPPEGATRGNLAMQDIFI